MSPSLTIAAHEYVTNVRRKEFILITLGLPVLFLVFGFLSVLGTTAATGMYSHRAPLPLGVMDRSGALDLRAAGASAHASADERAVVAYTDETAGLDAVKRGQIEGFVVLDRDYLASGRITVYRKSGGILSEQPLHVSDVLTRGLLAKARVQPRLVERAVNPAPDARVFVLEKGRFVPLQAARVAARFIVPYVFTILLTTCIFIAANYLLRGISDEKENRVIEVILSSVTAEDLLKGKLIGLAGVALTQVGIWLAMVAIPAAFMFARVVRLSPAGVAEAVLFFGLGFGLYATMMAGMGALGTSYRESQQISGVMSMGAFLPFVFMPLLLEAPNGVFARVLSLIPFTAPTTMVLRTTGAEVPLVDVALSAVVLAISIWLLIKLSAKLFRFGLLIYGKRPTVGETLRWLRAS